MFHSFDTEVAELFHDTNIATLFQNLCYWIAHNRTNGKNLHTIELNGKTVKRYFTFNSITAFTKQFSYFSKKQIENYLNKLREKGLIAKSNYNQLGFDRTSWYCLVDENYWMSKYLNETPRKKSFNDGTGNKNPDSQPDTTDEDEETPKRGNPFPQTGKWDSPNEEIHFPKTGNGTPRKGEPIPDINPDFKPTCKNTVAAAEDTSPSGEGAAAAPLKIQELKECLKTLDMTLEMDTPFYPRAVSYMQTHALDSGFLLWLYEYCVKKKPETLRGLFYTLFFKADLRELYLGLKARADGLSADSSPATEHLPRVRTEIVCPVCGTRYDDTVPYCPECDFRTHKHSDEQAVEKWRLVYAMSPEIRAAYESEKDAAFREAMEQRMSPKAAMERIDRKYHIVIPEKIEGGIACLT